MRTKLNLLAMLLVCGGAAGLLRPADASATYLADPNVPKAYCCYHEFVKYACCGDNGCRITARRCEYW